MSSVVREKLEDYFASMNPTSSRMMADIRSSRQEYSSDWDKLQPEKQSDILWKAIVKPEAIKKYEKITVEPLNVEYFPVLRVRPGEKIIVEEDNVSTRSFGNSWRDEHSAPFRWETASQLGLDIEDVSDTQKSNESIESLKEKDAVSIKSDGKKDEEVKRPVTVKRPEVPPPPVPPHAVPPIPPHIEPPIAPSPPPAEKTDTPIYAKVVKRKSSAKTLVISEMKAHRKAKEEMKPAVPPRMSLELKGSVDVTKFKTMPIDIDDIPKTGFDFLDNW